MSNPKPCQHEKYWKLHKRNYIYIWIKLALQPLLQKDSTFRGSPVDVTFCSGILVGICWVKKLHHAHPLSPSRGCLPARGVVSLRLPKVKPTPSFQGSLSSLSLCCSKATPYSTQKRKDAPFPHRVLLCYQRCQRAARLLPWISKSFRITTSSDTCQMPSQLKGQTLVFEIELQKNSPRP